MDNTINIFRFAKGDFHSAMKNYGVSLAAIESMDGGHVNTSLDADEYAAAVKLYSVTWQDYIKREIKRLGFSISDEDIKILKEMSGWKADLNEIGEMAREEWKNLKELELEARVIIGKARGEKFGIMHKELK